MRDREGKFLGGKERRDRIVQTLQEYYRCGSTGIPCCMFLKKGLVDLT